MLNTGDPEPSAHTYTFNRQGNPKKGVVDYNVSIIGSPGQTCVDTVSGTAQFDPTVQALTAQLSGVINVTETTCDTVMFTLTAHRDILAHCP